MMEPLLEPHPKVDSNRPYVFRLRVPLRSLTCFAPVFQGDQGKMSLVSASNACDNYFLYVFLASHSDYIALESSQVLSLL